MIVLDASVLIGHVSRTDVHHFAATALLAAASPGSMVVHPLTLAEVLVGAARIGRAVELRDDLLTAGIVPTTPDPDEPLRLAELRVTTGLKLPDCCVLSVALYHHADLGTFDSALADVARRRGVRVLP